MHASKAKRFDRTDIISLLLQSAASSWRDRQPHEQSKSSKTGPQSGKSPALQAQQSSLAAETTVNLSPQPGQETSHAVSDRQNTDAALHLEDDDLPSVPTHAVPIGAAMRPARTADPSFHNLSLAS